jgi:hypothetical protein
VTARYFAERFIPDCGALRRKIEAGSEAMMALDPEMFANRVSVVVDAADYFHYVRELCEDAQNLLTVRRLGF